MLTIVTIAITPRFSPGLVMVTRSSSSNSSRARSSRSAYSEGGGWGTESLVRGSLGALRWRYSQ